MLRGQHHVGCSKQRVGPGRVDHDRVTGFLHGEGDVGARASADPVSLHGLGGVGPVHVIQALQQAIPVSGDPQDPLAQVTPLNRMTTHFRLSINDFLVGEDGPQRGAPVDRSLVHVGQVVLEQLHENPLSPFKIMGIRRVDLTGPVERQSNGFQLAPEILDIGPGSEGRVGARLDRVLLSREAECIPAHGVQDIESPGHLVTPQDVTADKVLHVARMEARTAGIRKHVQQVIFFLF